MFSVSSHGEFHLCLCAFRHECLRARTAMSLSGYMGLVESFSTYQAFLKQHPDEAHKLSQELKNRSLSSLTWAECEVGVVQVNWSSSILAMRV